MSIYTEAERYSIALERGILVDPEDEWLLKTYTWRIENGYVRTDGGRHPNKWKMFLYHCIVGQPLWGNVIDHIDRNPLNNRRSNLRYVTHSENRLNSLRSDEAYHIQLSAKGNMYMVKIKRNRVQYYLGSYRRLDEAEAVRDKWLIEHAQ